MVSRFRYFSFKSLPMGERQRVPFAWMVGAVLLLALLILDTARVLFTGFSCICCPGRYGRSGAVHPSAPGSAHRHERPGLPLPSAIDPRAAGAGYHAMGAACRRYRSVG